MMHMSDNMSLADCDTVDEISHKDNSGNKHSASGVE